MLIARIKRLCLWGITVVVCAPAACVPVDSTLQDPVEDFSFEEDADPAASALPFVETELLVQPYPGAEDRTLSDLYAQAGAVVVDELRELDLTVLELPPGELHAVAAELDASGLIEALHKNYIFELARIPNDPLFDSQLHLTQINAPDAWERTVGDEEVIIAFVDTGVDAGHPDLTDKVIGGWNLYDDNADFDDVIGHGTQVAGVAAAASNNATGVAGVSWVSPIIAIRVTDTRGAATARHVAAGILWAVNHNARVINVSFAPLWSNRVVRTAAQNAFNRGSLVVISAGNSGGLASVRAYREALFVGALDSGGRLAAFSDRGTFVDLVAPGTGIRTAKVGADYGLVSGTSFAAPIVSGVAALAWSVNPELRPASILDAIVDSAVDLGEPGRDYSYGHGAVDAAGAVDKAARTASVQDTTPPTVRIDRPSEGASLSGRTIAAITATDVTGVADVVLSIDDVPYATDTREPYWFVIDTRRFSPGSHELKFVATDLVGNTSRVKSVTVAFALSAGASGEAPTGIEFHSPADGEIVSGNVTIQATIRDSDGLATVEWHVDGTSVFVGTVSGTSSGVTYLWQATGATAGSHTISIVVTDMLGRQATGKLELTTP